MELSEKNKSMALKILELFVSEKCTVAQADNILSYVHRTINNGATVQIADETRTLLG